MQNKTMITGTGVDIEQIGRFSEKPYEENRRFYEKLFTNNEIAYCLAKRNPYPHFTARFCAKEAIAKALDGKPRLDWHEVEIRSGETGKPFFRFKSGDKVKQAKLKRMEFHLSLSHDRTQAIAFVVVSSK